MKTWTVEIRPEFDQTFREPFKRMVCATTMRTAIARGLQFYWQAHRKHLTEATIKIRRVGV